MSTDTVGRDILTNPFPEAQAAITARLDEILDACVVKDFDGLAAYHLAGPKFSEFDDIELLDRQVDETAMRSEVEAFSAIDDLDVHADDLKIDVFGPVAVATCVFRAGFRVGGEQRSGRTRTTLVFVDAGRAAGSSRTSTTRRSWLARRPAAAKAGPIRPARCRPAPRDDPERSVDAAPGAVRHIARVPLFRITQDDAADGLLVLDPLALLPGMVLDQQFPRESASRGLPER